MKKALTVLTIALAIGMTATVDAEAKRLGGARNSGMQKQQTTQPANSSTAQPNTPAGPAQAAPAAGTAAAAAAPAAAAAKRSWAGPLTALAAGLGLAALASYFGFGEALANMMLVALVVMAVLAAIAFFMRKRAASGPAAAMAGAGGGSGAGAGGFGNSPAPRSVRIGAALGAASAAQTQPGNIPADFDVAAFVRNAKAQFTALQAANDAGDVARLRDFLTPEMFEMARQELDARGAATQRTETFGLEAQVVEVAEEADRYVVSVRFTGSTRDQAGAVPDDLDEVWHLTKPRTGMGGWVVAGIQQVGTSH